MKKLLSQLALSACALTALVSITSSARAGVIEAGSGREWRQVADTRNISRSDLSSVCDTLTGVCNGSAGGVDFSGWTLASRADVNQLFMSFGAPSQPIDQVGTVYTATDAAWAALLVDPDGLGGVDSGFLGREHFGAGGELLSYYVAGMTREYYEGANGAQHAMLVMVRNSLSASGEDSISSGGAFANIGSDTRGFWLYRTEGVGGSTVPVPGTLLLLASAGLAAASVRRSARR